MAFRRLEPCIRKRISTVPRGVDCSNAINLLDHGYKHLSVVLAYLMFIAFLIDQIQEYCCQYFQAALKKRNKISRLWEKIRGLFFYYYVETWSDLYTVIIEDKGAHVRDLLDTS